jgi:hypothetical protein
MPSVQEIAQDIYARAKAKGVDPNFALGLALREGLNKNTVGSATFGNRDAKGYSYGPWQLYSGSPVPGSVAPGGQASDFMRQYGQRPNAQNWQQQNEFALNLLKRLSPQQQLTTWYAIRDNGGHQNIANIGLQNALKMGLSNDATAAPIVASADPSQTSADPSSQLNIEAPPPPPEDVESSQMAMSEAPEYSSGIPDMQYQGSAAPMDFELPDASAPTSNVIHQKASAGKQRMAELSNPLGPLFADAVYGMAGKGRA